MFDQIPSVDEMTNYTMKNLLKNYGFKAKEIGPYRTNIRFDVFGINRYKREIRIYEVKSGRRDFVSDKKWQTYLPFCTHFGFVAPRGVIKPDELPPGIGLVEFYYEENESWNGEKFFRLNHNFTRGCSRLREKVDDEHYIDLLEGVVMRLMNQTDELRYYWHLKDELRNINQNLIEIISDVRQVKKVNGLEV